MGLINNLKKWQVICGAIIITLTLVGSVYGIALKTTDHFVNQSELRVDFDKYKLQEERRDVEKRIYDLEDRILDTGTSEDRRNRMRDLKDQLRNIEERLGDLDS